eukprot:scaffold101977_cov40-Tisochrysis_lutea.AAC.2
MSNENHPALTLTLKSAITNYCARSIIHTRHSARFRSFSDEINRGGEDLDMARRSCDYGVRQY